MNTENFATFILTHGRADNVKTYDALREHGYTGKIYLLIDNEDSQQQDYIDKYRDEVIVFDKLKQAQETDTCDNYKKRNSIVFARNYNFKIAREMGIKYFWQLDDDYTSFRWTFDNENNYVVQINNPLHQGGAHIRTIEWKHLLPPEKQKEITGTLLTTETPYSPKDWHDYEYPFPDAKNKVLLSRYQARAQRLKNIIFAGRLGEYRYYDMDQAIGRALVIADKLLKGELNGEEL